MSGDANVKVEIRENESTAGQTAVGRLGDAPLSATKTVAHVIEVGVRMSPAVAPVDSQNAPNMFMRALLDFASVMGEVDAVKYPTDYHECINPARVPRGTWLTVQLEAEDGEIIGTRGPRLVQCGIDLGRIVDPP